MTVRTRFAPSPTGYLHIGGVRTALFSWLYARQHNGHFILRIEDTDRERSTDESVQVILDGMNWLDLYADEGPFFQTHRFDRYRTVLEQLLAENKAYYCYCTKERLDNLRQTQLANKEKPRYDGLCRQLNHPPATDVNPVIRFKNPQVGEVIVKDLIKGNVFFKNSELDDLIIARSDGTPTYNFTVVVDDWDMNITHVIRGDDHLNNTPRQINLLQALNANLPEYAHLPMILGSDGQRLSKRHGAVSVTHYRELGYLPVALLNYLARLGWAHGDQEIFSVEELINLFDIRQVNKAAATFNPDKLRWLNQHYIKTLPPAEVAKHLAHQASLCAIDFTQGPPLEEIVQAQAERAKTLQEMAQNSSFFFTDAINWDENAVSKHLKPTILEPLTTLYENLKALEIWNAENIHTAIQMVAEQYTLKFGKIAQPVRVAVTGGTTSPPIDVTLYLIGQARSLQRIQQALSFLENADV